MLAAHSLQPLPDRSHGERGGIVRNANALPSLSRTRCIGGLNQRKFFCDKGLSGLEELLRPDWQSSHGRYPIPQLKEWKLSPMDIESVKWWDSYTKAKEIVFQRTHRPEAPWWVVDVPSAY